jgi:Tfp pilus assembly protein PilO
MHLRWWTTGLGIYAILLVGVSLAAHFVWGSGHEGVARDLEGAKQATKRTSDALASVRAEIARVQDVQRTIQLVTDAPDWGLLICALGRELGDDVVMKEARLSVQVPATAGGATPAKPAPAAARARYKLELRGLARSQAGVSRLVSRMEAEGKMRTRNWNSLEAWQIDATGAVLVVLLGLAAYWLQIGPSIQCHRDAQAQTTQLDEENDKHHQLELSLRSSREHLKSVHDFVAQNRLNLEPSGRVNEHVSALSDLAGRFALQLDGVEPAPESVGPSYTTVPIRIFGRGKYRDIVAYLAEARTRMRDKALARWEIYGSPSADSPVVTFSLNFLWYAAPKSSIARK